MKKIVVLPFLSFFVAVILLFGVASLAFPNAAQTIKHNALNTTKTHVHNAQLAVDGFANSTRGAIASSVNTIEKTANNAYNAGMSNAHHAYNFGAGHIHSVATYFTNVQHSLSNSVKDTFNTLTQLVQGTTKSAHEKWDGAFIVIGQTIKGAFTFSSHDTNIDTNARDDAPVLLASLDDAQSLAAIEPSAGDKATDDTPPEMEYEYAPQDANIISEVVLVPREKTVISSSRDGKIKSINFANGDVFNQGDILLEYECKDIRAEIDAASFEQKFAKQKMLTTSRLYDLNIASKIEKEQASTEKNVARAKRTLAQSKLDSCIIRADFDGRVVKRLANPNEYTRTDRVLLEIASTGTLDAEFLMPSVWLRWINIGAPLKLVINETDKEYTGEIARIYGEVDPVSQSIQVRATLNDYEEPLLPGMSGQVDINVNAIRDAGIRGFLETTGR